MDARGGETFTLLLKGNNNIVPDRNVIPNSLIITRIKEKQYASFIHRLIAFVMDYFLMILVILNIVVLIVKFDLQLSSSILNMMSCLLFPLYNAISLSLFGTTIGKRLMKLEVVSEKSSKLGIGQILIRETAGKLISSIFFGLGYTAMILHPKKQTWHDRIAKTLVFNCTQLSLKKEIVTYVGLSTALISFAILMIAYL